MNPRSYALNLLKRRLRSREELRAALTRRKVEEAEIEALLNELTEVGLLDDWRFARSWVHTRDRLSPRGEYVLKEELRQKGIAAEIITEVLKERQLEVEDEESPDEFSLALQAARGRQRLYAGLPKEVRERRLTSFLQRRGFSYAVIRRILDA